MIGADGSASQPADVLVIFGISGDLARVMTFGSLYRLEERGQLDCPVVGVAFDRWSRQDLADHARSAVAGTGTAVDEEVLARLLARMDYVAGDFADPATYAAVAEAIRGRSRPVFYLEVPPSLFAVAVDGLAAAGLVTDARVVVEKPFGHDLASARALNQRLHRHLAEEQIYRVDHFLGKMPVQDVMYLRFCNEILEPVWRRHHVAAVQITMAEDFGVDDRGSFYDPVGALRDVIQNHLLQLVSLVAMEPPLSFDAEDVNDRKADVLKSIPAADPRRYVRGQYDGYQSVAGVAPESDTETYCALRLEVDTWRWRGVPFFIRAGKELPERVTEVRIVFHHPPAVGHHPEVVAGADPNQLVLRIDPDPGARLRLQAKAAQGAGLRSIHLDMEFAAEGGAGPTPYEELLGAAMRGDRAAFTRWDAVEASWRIVQPLLDNPPPAIAYPRGSWGPAAAHDLVRGAGSWHAPWLD